MKRVLLISYFMPPRGGVGSIRTDQLVRYLPQFGWDVTVLTAELRGHPRDGVRVISTPDINVKQVLKRLVPVGNRSLYQALGTSAPMYQDAKSMRQRFVEAASTAAGYATNKFGWYAGGLFAARRLTARRKFDAILSTSGPESAHLLAASAARRVPWVADFRDLWDGNSAAKTRVERLFNRVLERRVMRHASRMVTVSEPLAEQLRHRYNVPVACVHNAFDPSEWVGVPFQKRERCTVLYAGHLYEGRRDPRILFEAASKLIASRQIAKSDLEIILHTAPRPWLSRLVEQYGLQDVATIRPMIGRANIMALERSSDLLWIMLFDGESDAGVLTGKLFEYLGARRPVIVTGGPSECAIDGILRETRAGVRARTVDEVAEQLVRAVRRHESVPNLVASDTASYEARYLGQRFASILDDAVGAPVQYETPEEPVPLLGHSA